MIVLFPRWDMLLPWWVLWTWFKGFLGFYDAFVETRGSARKFSPTLISWPQAAYVPGKGGGWVLAQGCHSKTTWSRFFVAKDTWIDRCGHCNALPKRCDTVWLYDTVSLDVLPKFGWTCSFVFLSPIIKKTSCIILQLNTLQFYVFSTTP